MAKPKKAATPPVAQMPMPQAPAVPALNMGLLAQIVSATLANSSVYTNVADHTPLIEAGMVEVNSKDIPLGPNGEIATRATDAGIALVGKGPGAVVGSAAASSAAAPTVSKEKPTFTLDAGVEIPTIKRGFAAGGGKGREAIYPFAQMEPGQSFFVPATAERDDPAMALASTVSAATRRYATPLVDAAGQPVMETVKRAKRGDDGKIMKDGAGKVIKEEVTIQKMQEVRKFVIRTVDETAQGRGKGARVWRTL